MKIKDIVTLMAVMATAVGCTQEAGEQLEEGVPIQLATTIAQNYTKGTSLLCTPEPPATGVSAPRR